MNKYKILTGQEKLHYLSFAAHWLAAKPELVGDIKTDIELIERLNSFAEVIYNSFICKDDTLPPRPGS